MIDENIIPTKTLTKAAVKVLNELKGNNHDKCKQLANSLDLGPEYAIALSIYLLIGLAQANTHHFNGTIASIVDGAEEYLRQLQ